MHKESDGFGVAVNFLLYYVQSRFPGEMRREDSGDGPVEAGQVMTGRRPQSGAFRSSQRYTAAQRLPSGLLNTITRNDLYTEDPGDLPDDVA